MEKNLVSGLILAYSAQIRVPSFYFGFFFKSCWISHLPLRTISEETNEPILRTLSDGQTDRQKDQWTRLIL